MCSTSSSVEIETLHQARNFLNLRNISKKATSDINACEDLLLKYWYTLLIAAFDQITTEHHFYLSDRGDDTDDKTL